MELLTLHIAAEEGDAVAVRQLLAAGAAADEADIFGKVPLHRASESGNAAVVRRLLAAAPSTAAAQDDMGYTPLHIAAASGYLEAAQLLLEAAPATALVPADNGLTPLHCAAYEGHIGLIQLLLAVAPSTATATARGNPTPLLFAASGNHTAVAQLLLQAAPDAALICDVRGAMPLHFAAGHHNVALVHLLLKAAPATADAANYDGNIPLNRIVQVEDWHLKPSGMEAAHLLVGAAQSVQPTLSVLAKASPAVASIYTDLVCRLPLTQADWQLVPAPCPNLARALPAVLARSAAEAGWLVGRLAEWQRAQLRTAALSLARSQREMEGVTPLPSHINQHILAPCLLDDQAALRAAGQLPK